MYELLKGSGELTDVVLPEVIDRLVTLESLHKQGMYHIKFFHIIVVHLSADGLKNSWRF